MTQTQIEAKHTPGPWIIRTTPDTLSERTDEFSHYISQLRREFGHIGKDVAEIMGWGGDLSNDAEMLANARLLRAAPDLLAALHRVMQLQASGGNDEIFAEVRAAIAKAEGRS